MRADQEITFELTDDLRDRIFDVRSISDAAALLDSLGVPNANVTRSTSNQIKSLIGHIRDSERQYGSAPIDFSDDPLMGLGHFDASDAKFCRHADFNRPVVGIRVLLSGYRPDDPSGTWMGVDVLPLRAELTEVVIPEGITKMDPYSFMDCSRVRRVTIPSGMREIPAGAFWGCTGLTEVDVPDGVTSIGPAAFACCENLRRVALPASLEHVGCGAFRDCARLDEVAVPPEFALPDASHVFEGCKLSAEHYCRQTNQPVDKERALDDLDELLSRFAHMRLDGYNSINSMFLDRIDAPDLGDIGEPARDAVDKIHRTLCASTMCFPTWEDDFHKTTECDLLLLSHLIVDTLESISGVAPKVYDCPGDIEADCEKNCFMLTDAAVIQAGDEWYVLFGDWSD